MPVRKIPRNYRNVTGVAALSKSTGDAQFESTLEQDFLLLLQNMPSVRSFEVQPLIVRFTDSFGQSRQYTPDVLARFKDGTVFVYEVKHRKDLFKDWILLKPRFKAAIHYTKTRHWRFKIMTEVEIRTPYLENLRFLKRYRTCIKTDPRFVLLDYYLEELQETTPGELITSAAHDAINQAQLLHTLWCMVSEGLIRTDLSQPLTMNSPIWYPVVEAY